MKINCICRKNFIDLLKIKKFLLNYKNKLNDYDKQNSDFNFIICNFYFFTY